MRKYLIIFIAIFLISPNFSNAATSVATTGLIPGSIWYSSEPLKEKDIVKIYTAVWNGGSKDLNVKVEFYDKSTVLGVREVVAPKNSLKEVSIPWVVTSGDHAISAKIISASSGVAKDKISVSISETDKDDVFVPVAVKEVDGVPVSSKDVIASQVEKVTSDITNLLPASVPEKVTENLNVIEDFRAETSVKVEKEKELAKEKLKSANDRYDKNITEGRTSTVSDNTEGPIASVKVFLFTILSFIVSSKIVFYGLIALIIFWILRSIYNKIRNR